MMRAGLERRLVALEEARTSRTTVQRPFMGATNLMVLLIAGHLGGMADGDSVAEAYGWALGYAGGTALKSALGAESGSPAAEERNRWHGEAVDRLLALNGVSTDEGGGPVSAALRALLDDLPEHARRHPLTRMSEPTQRYDTLSV